MKKNILFVIILFQFHVTIAQFAPPVTVTEVGTPRDIGSGDFNQDGFIDLVYSSDIDTPFIHVVLNDGNGNFLPPSFVISDISQGNSVGIGDLDGDGFLDIATQGETNFEFNWYAGNGDGTFTDANIITSSIGGSFISETVIFDLDANGHQDIIIIDRGVLQQGFVGWFKNNGEGDIDTLATIFQGLDGPFKLNFGDLDGDIYPDVVVGKKAPEPIFIFEYDGADGFSYEALNTTINWGSRILIEDINLDGENDIIATDANSQEIYYWRKFNNGLWSNQFTFVDLPFPNIVGGIGYKDINQDGKPDFVYSSLNGELIYYPNNTNTNTNFGDPVIIDTGLKFSRNLVIVDSDNDYDYDIVVASQVTFFSMGENKLSYFRNLGNDASMIGNVFWDENENEVFDSTESFLPNFPIEVSPSAYAAFTNNEGGFRIFADSGTYELIPEFGDCWGASNGSNFTIDFDGVNTVEDILIGVKQISTAENVHVGLTSGPTRCGFTVPFWMNYTNTGCQTISGKIQMLPSDLTTLISSEIPPDQTINDTLIWEFTNLYPGQNRQIDLTFEIADASFLGETISIPLQFLIENPDGSFEQIDSSLFTSIINCAYDPNDKTTYPRRSEIAAYDKNYTLMDERLDYTIRFQNTGTDTAFNIIIRDELSSNVDFSTFQPLSGSHPFETVLHEDGLVEFYFRNILLVDSLANEPMSHGYVQFSIETNDNLSDPTSIYNSAEIYFDFNEPILTNTVENVMVEMLPPITAVDDLETKELQIFPNPVQVGSALYLNNLPKGDKSISVFNSLGQLFFSEKSKGDSFKVLTENWKTGIYFVFVENENVKRVGKVMVE